MPLDNLPSSRLEERLRRELKGEVKFDAFTRGRYSTDASVYQIEPLGVAVPKDKEDIATALTIAREEGVTVLPRGGGTSQCGQTVGRSLVLDCSKYMQGIVAFDAEARRVTVQPGVVMERLNARLKQHKLWFPVDVSTGDRATIGGMTANNSCGARSIRYGNMVHNVRAIDAILADGTEAHFGEVPSNFGEDVQPERYRNLVSDMRTLHRREADEIDARIPKLLRKVGGYNIDMLSDEGHNMANLLVGSEGTLAFFNAIELDLQPIPPHRVLGICHFPSFYKAMDATQHIVKLDPAAVVEATDPAFQSAVWDVRRAGLNIMMSMKGDGKPISFIEDCAVELKDLADYTERLNEVFERHGTKGTWYAHASVGCLHVRPVLNMKDPGDVATMRAVAEEAFALVREYKGSHSGEHGDGLVRSDFNETMFGPRIVRAFEAVKDAFDPVGLLNPNRITRPPRMDDRTLFRYAPGYAAIGDFRPQLDWSEHPGPMGGLLGAVEMCNNNGTCRSFDAGVMCPSYRVTRDEVHVTRGRANTLRLALTGQLGADAMTSDAMADAMALCVSCKACRRECPTGVDMAKMKIEVTAARTERFGMKWRESLIAELPRYAPYVARMPGLANLRNHLPPLRWLMERVLGVSRARR